MATVQTAAGSTTPGIHARKPGIRLASLDAYRGLLVLVLVAGGFGAPAVSRFPALGWFAGHVLHAETHGFRLAEPVQPGLAFIAGVALPLALAGRKLGGAALSGLVGHAIWRCVALIALGNLLANFAAGGAGVRIQLLDPLSQIGLGCLVCFFVAQLRLPWQIGAALGLVAVRWAAPAGPAAMRDGLTTSATTAMMVVFGCWAGRFLLRPYPAAYKVKVLAVIGAATVAEGFALEPVIPIGGGAWTASFAFFSLGWVLLLFALLFWLLECRSWGAPGWLLAGAGENAILAYCLSCLLYKWWNAGAPELRGGVFLNLVVFTFVWLVCWWFRRKGIRVKL